MKTAEEILKKHNATVYGEMGENVLSAMEEYANQFKHLPSVQPIPVNCMHATCPECGANVDVIPANGTAIVKPVCEDKALSESLEEAAERIIDLYHSETLDESPYKAFVFGAQWQASQPNHAIGMIEQEIKELEKKHPDWAVNHKLSIVNTKLELLNKILKQLKGCH
jgi:uncharacterized protein (UPF0212 family)